MKLEGILPALTTPFDATGPSLDNLCRNIASYERLDLDGYLVLGSTGEGVLLDDDERHRVLDAARAAIPAGKPMVAGLSAESTRAARRQARVAADFGADAVLVSTPHYFRAQMTTEALVDHFTAVAEESAVPVLLYNVPKFTGFSLPVETVLQVGEHDNVAGLKESSGDLDYLRRILAHTVAGFGVLCGDPTILRPALEAGAVGAILAAANVLPEPMTRLVKGRATPEDLSRETLEATFFLAGRHGVPGIKAAMDARGLYGGPVRGPLVPVPESVVRGIEQVVTQLVARRVLDRRRL